ncbi:MAG: SGNH/GDSL hydrolase family protein, partial [Lachnospiraceae bacterium]|nr:SGNH/GDSL hydrolase family protein [Lachnospiraceae bacterium]
MKKSKLLMYVVAGIVAALTLCFALLFLNKKKTAKYDIVFFGDSIIACDHSERDLVTKFNNESEYSVLNGAFGGMTLSYIDKEHLAGNQDNLYTMIGLSESVKERDFTLQVLASQKENVNVVPYWHPTSVELNEADWNSVKYVLIEHGANDYLNGVSLDNKNNKYDPYTFAGALRTSIENIKKGAPNAKIVLVTPIYMNPWGLSGDCYEADYGGGLLEAYVQKEK